MSVAAALECAVRGEEVPGDVLEAAFGEIADGKAGVEQVAGLLVALRTKGETVGEIVAAARALRSRAVCVRFDHPHAVDVCGTGGDGAGTFNISTATALVVAGAGVPVAKHGNRAASSRSGAIDVFEALGVRAELSVEASVRLLREVGIAPFHARHAHPAMRHVAPTRAALGIRTVMNCLGPLLNPAGVRRQLVGVYERALVQPLAAALAELGAERALVVHGEDGLDEITVTGRSFAAELREGRVRSLSIDPEELGVPRARPGDLAGGDPAENAALVRAILDGEAGPRRDVVVLNAAAALWVADVARDLPEGLDRARHSIDSGAARDRLARLARASQAVAP
ncbi:MAG: anthranilate phosphoribosyltransferase [Myxococcota bacterium]